MPYLEAIGGTITINGEVVATLKAGSIQPNILNSLEPIDITLINGPTRFCSCCGAEQKETCAFRGIEDEYEE